MATSKELLKAIEQGAEIKTNQGHTVEYSPRRPGDRMPWAYRENTTSYRYTAANCVAVFPEPVIETVETCCDHAPMFHGARGCDECDCTTARTAMAEEVPATRICLAPADQRITPEVIEALRTLRKTYLYPAEQAAFDVLDNAGIFAAIDEATGYDVDPEPERVSKCNCIKSQFPSRFINHAKGCPGDPEEWGDMAYTVVGQDDMREVAARLRAQPYRPDRVGNHVIETTATRKD